MQPIKCGLLSNVFDTYLKVALFSALMQISTYLQILNYACDDNLTV